MATSIVSFAGYSRVVTQRSLSSPNNGCEEDYDFIGLTRTQLTQSLIFSSRRRQKMSSGSQGAIVHTVQPRKMLCQFLNTTQHSLPVDPPFGCVFCVFNNCFCCLTHSQFLAFSQRKSIKPVTLPSPDER